MDGDSTRRAVLGALAAGGALGLAGCGDDQGGAEPTPTTTPVLDEVGLKTVADGFEAPIDVAFPPGADRRYVAEQSGRILVHDADGVREPPLLDLGERVTVGGEKGLLGIALHPDFAANRRLFVRYSSPSRAGTPADYSHTYVLAEFAVGPDGRQVRAGSERSLLEIPQPQGNHNAGSLAFGPEGYLYVGTGDGGAANDQGAGHVADWYDGVAGGNGQDVAANLLGSILRIDVDAGDPYAIPPDNPLVDGPGLDEHYAWGLRNPWRMAFDDGDLFVGDVGQSAWEEVDLVERGGNYGWNVREGAECFGADDCPDRTPASVRGGEPLLDPIVAYPHSGAAVSGISVIGGEVYRGSELPALEGTYVFGDLQAAGELFIAEPPADGDGEPRAGAPWSTGLLPVADAGAGAIDQIRSFGRDPDGEVYVLGVGGGTGGLYRLAAP